MPLDDYFGVPIDTLLPLIVDAYKREPRYLNNQ